MAKKSPIKRIRIILALSHISGKLNCLDARIVHTQHDEIIVAARDVIEDQVLTIVKEPMEEAFQGIIPEVPFVAEIRQEFKESMGKKG